jgi:hypothetical protein
MVHRTQYQSGCGRAWRIATHAMIFLMLYMPPVAAQDSIVVVPNNKQVTDESRSNDYARRVRTADRLADQSQHIGRLYFLIPEYHDEQHFQTGPNSFGPMVYIYASPFLGAFTRMSEIVEQGTYGTFAALVYVDAPAGTVLPPQYTRLDLQPGENCVWLANPSGNMTTGWRAYVTRLTGGRGCLRPTGPPPQPLLVYPSSPLGFTHADFPAVARFGEAQAPAGATFGQPLLGVKCLRGWCEIGPKTPITPRSSAAASTGKKGRIKGWHDEQILAAQDPAGVLRPTVRAMVEPVDGLEALSLASFPPVSPANPNQGWVLVGRILLDSDPPASSKYWTWGLRRGANHLHLRQTTARWEMSITHSGSPIRYIWQNVVREPHTDVPVPGTARWRFASFDPMGVWVRCGEACCSGDGGAQ